MFTCLRLMGDISFKPAECLWSPNLLFPKLAAMWLFPEAQLPSTPAPAGLCTSSTQDIQSVHIQSASLVFSQDQMPLSQILDHSPAESPSLLRRSFLCLYFCPGRPTPVHTGGLLESCLTVISPMKPSLTGQPSRVMLLAPPPLSLMKGDREMDPANVHWLDQSFH